MNDTPLGAQERRSCKLIWHIKKIAR